ncbi:MAG: hypothetical protein KAT43_04000 [Nanoarchaeota archaeon]|nr:hypothetical protein [Nanoarchaeota archaeon]
MVKFRKFRQRDLKDSEIYSLIDSNSKRSRLVEWVLDHYKPIAAVGASALVIAGLGGALLWSMGRDEGERNEKLEREIHEGILRQEHARKIKELKTDLDKEKKRNKRYEKEKNDLEDQRDGYKNMFQEADKLSGTYKTQIDNLNESVSKLRGDIKGLDGRIEEIIKELKSTREANTGLKKNLDDSERNLQTVQKKYEARDKEYVELDGKQKEIQEAYDKLQEDIKKNVKDTEALNNSIERDKTRLKKQKTALEEDLRTAKENHETLQKAKVKIEKRYKNTLRDIEALRTSKGDLDKDYAGIVEKNKGYTTNIERLEKLVNDLTNSLRDISERTKKLTEMHEQETRKLKKEHNTKIEEREKAYSKERTKLVDERDKYQGQLEGHIDEIAGLNEKITGLNNQIVLYEKKKEEDKATIDAQSNDIEKKRKRIGELEKRIEELKGSEDSNKEEIKNLKEEREILKVSLKKKTEEYDTEKEAHDERKEKYKDLSEILDNIPDETKALSGTRIAFVLEGNLYVVDANYGSSNRAFEIIWGNIRRPRLSPDKKNVAYEYKHYDDADKEGIQILRWRIGLVKITEDLSQKYLPIITSPEFRKPSEPNFLKQDMTNQVWAGNNLLVFISGEKNDLIWTYSLTDGKVTCLVKNDAGRIGNLAVSPNGEKVAYVVHSDYDERNACQIFVSDILGNSPGKQITLEDNKYNTQPAWVNDYILVYVKEGRESDSEIQLVDTRLKELWKKGKKWKYRNVTKNVGSTWFLPVNWLSSRNKADFNPAVNEYGYVLFTNEDDGLVLKLTKGMSIPNGVLSKPDNMPYDKEIILDPKGTDKHSRAIFFPDRETILAKVGDKLYRFKKSNSGYEAHFITKVDKESEFHVR